MIEEVLPAVVDFAFLESVIAVVIFGIGCLFGGQIEKSFNFWKW